MLATKGSLTHKLNRPKHRVVNFGHELVRTGSNIDGSILCFLDFQSIMCKNKTKEIYKQKQKGRGVSWILAGVNLRID